MADAPQNQSTIKLSCIVAVGTWDGSKCLLKTRDRNYEPKLKIYHELRNGVEVLYVKDEGTGWVEGLNEFGIGVVNSALMVGRDEAEKKIVKTVGKKSKDGARILKALESKTLDEAIDVACNYKGGIKGHSFVSDADKTVSIEATSKHECVTQFVRTDQVHVRTNHGFHYEDSGYTGGDDYVSSVYRRDKAKVMLRKVDSPTDLGPTMYGKRKDKGEMNSVIRNTDNMRTSSQLVLDLTKRVAYLYLIPGQQEFAGVKTDFPEDYKPKLHFHVYEYDDDDKAKAVKTASTDLLPIMDPQWNLREVCKHLILLEDHLFHPRKRCMDCIRKHLLTSEALAEETITLDVDRSFKGATTGLADRIREVWTMVQDVHNDGAPGYPDIAQAVRKIRKGLVEVCYHARVAAFLNEPDTPSVARVVASFENRAGRLLQFPDKTPRRPKHTETIGGTKYALSADGGPLGDMLDNVDEGHAPGMGPRVIQGPQSKPFKFLWAYDTERGDVGMWRVTDGNEKVYGGADNFRSKLVKLDKQGELNRVTTIEMRSLTREMQKRENKMMGDMDRWLKEHKTEYQALVDEVAQDVFDKDIKPGLERRLADLDKGVVPIGFKVIEQILDHESEASQMRGHVIAAATAEFTPQLIEAELRRRGIDPDAEGHDIQAADWAVGDIRQEAWKRYKRAAVRVAAKFKDKKKVKTPDGNEMIVYEYSDNQIARRNNSKAKRIETLRKSIGELRSLVSKDLKSKDPKTRHTALAVALMDETFERVGNKGSAKEGHFGVTGWRVEHVTFKGSKATIKYVGKSGVDQEKTISNPKVVSALKKVVKGKSKKDNLLCEADGTCRVNSTVVNTYLKPFAITAKDIRGFHANEMMKKHLKKGRKGKLPDDKKKREKQLKDEFKVALEAAAAAVGHEPATLKGQYLVPGLEDSYLKDGTISTSLDKTGLDQRGMGGPLRPRYVPPGIYAKTAIIGLNNATDGPEDEPDLRGFAGLVSSLTLFELAVIQDMNIHNQPIIGGEGNWTLRGHSVQDDVVDELVGADYLEERCGGEVTQSDLFDAKYWLYTGHKREKMAGLLPLEAFTTRLATKTRQEKEDEDVNDLVRPSPKKKPPRKDLHNRRLKDHDDPDDGDEKQDRKDQSQNWKDGTLRRAWYALSSKGQNKKKRFQQQKKQNRADRKQNPKDQTKKPGETWQTDSGAWSGKSKDGEQTRGGFEDADSAKMWIDTGKVPSEDEETGDKAPAKDESKTEDQSPIEDGEDSSAKGERSQDEVNRMLEDTKNLVLKLLDSDDQGNSDLPRDFQTKVRTKLDSMDPTQRKEFMESFATTTQEFPKDPPMGVEAVAAGRKALGANLRKKSPTDAGKVLAQAFYAERVTFNPTMLSGKAVSTETGPSSEEETEGNIDFHTKRSLDAKAFYSQVNKTERNNAINRVDESLQGLDPMSPRSQELTAIKNGIALAAIIAGEEPDGLQVSEQFSTLANAMAAVGEENRFLGTLSDLASPEGQDAIRDALSTMTDQELADYIGGAQGDHPYAPIAEAMLQRTEEGSGFTLSESDRAEMRERIVDSIIEDISFQDPLVGDYLEAYGEKNTQKTRTKIKEKLTRESYKGAAKGVAGFASGEESVSTDNEDLDSLNSVTSFLQGIATTARNALIDGLAKDYDKTPKTDNVAIANATRKENSNAAITQRKIKPSEKKNKVKREPGTTWESPSGWWAQTPEDEAAGPFNDKAVSEGWASGEIGKRMGKTGQDLQAVYDFTPWLKFLGT